MRVLIEAEPAEIAVLIETLQGQRDAKELAKRIQESFDHQSSKEIKPDFSKM